MPDDPKTEQDQDAQEDSTTPNPEPRIEDLEQDPAYNPQDEELKRQKGG